MLPEPNEMNPFFQSIQHQSLVGFPSFSSSSFKVYSSPCPPLPCKYVPSMEIDMVEESGEVQKKSERLINSMKKEQKPQSQKAKTH